MSNPTIIELNDSGILVADTRGILLCEPGYARLTTSGIQTGKEALRHAFLEPQQVYHHFWNRLNLAPLANPSNQARHHADLAYNQLLALHSAGGRPQQVIFSVPGTFSREQLSILLGLAQASPFEAVGLVDSAVAALASLDETGEWLHLDLHLHQAILTRVRLGEQIERLQVQAVANAGLQAMLDSWAQHIAHLFIQQHRYDPLHTALGEQQLYDRMPDWLDALTREREITIELESQRRTCSLSLSRDSFSSSVAPVLMNLRQAIRRQDHHAGLVVSDRLARLPCLQEQLAARLVLPTDIVAQNAYPRRDQLGPVEGGLVLHTRLPNNRVHDAAPVACHPDSTATHLLFQHRAHAIGEQLYIGFGANEPSFGHTPPPAPWLYLTRNGPNLQWHSEGGLDCTASDPALSVGTRLTVRLPDSPHPHELVLIEVG